MSTVPYALFRFNGEEVAMTEAQFGQACRDAKVCRCGSCLCCRALEYARDNEAKEAAARALARAATIMRPYRTPAVMREVIDLTLPRYRS